MSAKTRLSRHEGFSLIELMVAVAITGMIVLGVMSLLRGAGESAGDAARQTKQSAELRNAMALIQRDLAAADRPALRFGDAGGIDGAGQGNEIVFTRTEDRGGASAEYFVQRIWFEDGATVDQRGEVRMQVKAITAAQMEDLSSDAQTDAAEVIADPASSPAQVAAAQAVIDYATEVRDVASAQWSGEPTRVLVKAAEISASEKLFVFYEKAGTTTTNPDLVSLIDVNLRSDSDGASEDDQGVTLRSSVYLRKIGRRTTGSGSPINC